MSTRATGHGRPLSAPLDAPVRASECYLHGGGSREPWSPRFRDIEVVRCDHLGSAYVVEMYLVAGDEEHVYRSHHMHYVRDGRREVHALDDALGAEASDVVWKGLVAAMERGAAPRESVARFHGRRRR
jgi:hypothetical protein